MRQNCELSLNVGVNFTKNNVGVNMLNLYISILHPSVTIQAKSIYYILFIIDYMLFNKWI